MADAAFGADGARPPREHREAGVGRVQPGGHRLGAAPQLRAVLSARSDAVTSRSSPPPRTCSRRAASTSGSTPRSRSRRRTSTRCERGGGQEAILDADRGCSTAEAADLLGHFDGLLLIGGPDVDPAIYGQEPVDSGLRRGARARRLRARARARRARRSRCRCSRSVAATRCSTSRSAATSTSTSATGFPGHGRPGVENGAELHEVIIEPGSRLAGIMGVERVGRARTTTTR